MDEWKSIRQDVLVNGLSKRGACEKYKLGWHTLNKILLHSEPPGYRQKEPRPKRVLAAALPIIHEILEADQKAPKKQRHTAKRIFEQLKAEYGYLGGKTVVEDAVRAWRQTHQEVFLPLVHPPGEAQVDFGEATIRQGGVERKVALFVMTLPYSGAIFMQAFPRECSETGVRRMVPARRCAELRVILMRHPKLDEVVRRHKPPVADNSAIAVIEVLGGRERKLTKEFLRLQSHYLFQEHFCLVRTPNEKGHVERLIGFARRNFLVPVPEISSLFEPIHYLALLERKPGGFDYARPLENWNLPECWALLRRRLEAHDPRHGTRSYIQVLRLLEKYSLAQLTAAVEYGLDIDVIDAASIRTIAEHRADEPVKLFPLDGRPQLAHVHVETTDVSSYQVLLTDLSTPTEVTS